MKIAANCIINTATVIEHHCFIGHSSHLAPGVVLAGNVKVGKKTFVGIGSSIVNNVTIPHQSFIKAHSMIS